MSMFTDDQNIVCATSEHAEACKRIEATRNDIKCLKVSDSTECLQQILKKNAHFGTFTPEEAILASYYINDQVRAVAQVRHPDRTDEKFAFETVVVVHKNFAGGLSGLQNVTYCHPGFIQGRYWSDLVLKVNTHESLIKYNIPWNEINESCISAFRNDCSETFRAWYWFRWKAKDSRRGPTA